MSENLRNYTKALYGFDHVARLATAKAWDRKSPCEGWTGRDVAGHVIGGVKVTIGHATGKAPSMKSIADSSKVAGADPYATFSKARDTVLSALDHPGVLAQMRDTWFGNQSVDEFLVFMTADMVIHAWDLARTAEVDERLDPASCKRALAVFKPFPAAMLRSAGVFGAAIPAEKGADAQAKLLAFAGRRA